VRYWIVSWSVTLCDSDPLVPVTVTVIVCRDTFDAVVSVSVDDELVDCGLKLAVTRLGIVLEESDTAPVKPFAGVTVIVYVALPPREITREVGVAESEKLAPAGAPACTTSCTEVVPVSEPLVPVTVSVYVPAGVDVEVATVMVDVLVVGFVSKEADAPVGNPPALSDTAPVNPPLGVTDTAYVVAVPALTVRVDGVDDSVKLGVGAACTTSCTPVVCESEPLVPVTVTG
jgi:hypothetical protein